MRSISLSIGLTFLLVVGMSASASGQAGFATASGTVEDATGAVIPGVSVTALDTATGVETEALTNSSGAYNFAALQPGTYTFSASLPGFQTSIVTDVRLGTAVQIRVDFDLEVAGVATAVEISVSADQLLLESSPSVGEALEQDEVANLPLVTGDVLDLVRVMAGVNTTFDDVFAAEDTTFAGVSAQNINVSRDGLTVNEQRWPNGIDASTRLNPDLVGEMRLILTPVDAEKGRGSGQVEITTRSGGNEFHGGIVYNVKNSAIDARSWQNNRDGVVANWANKHQYSINVGGPIQRGRTFFFALWDHQIANFRNTRNPIVLTPCARNGIFRYFDTWNNGNALQLPTGGGNPSIAVVDGAGNPMAPATNPDGTSHNGILRYASVFGPLQNIPSAADCSDAIVDTGSAWDTNRDRDTSGYLNTLLGKMPEVNNYDAGDGLNTAGHRYTRSFEGDDNLFGITDDSMRTQINLNIDHIFNPDHKIQGAYTYEWDWSDEDIADWPTGFRGRNDRRPQVLAVNFVSTLSPSLVNEARFGMSRTGVNRVAAIDRAETRDEALAVFPVAANGLPIIADFGQGEVDFSGALVLSGGFPIFTARDTSPRWSFGDTMSWTTGRHSFRFGGTFIIANSKTDNLGEVGGNTGNPGSYYPTASGGMTGNSIITSLGNGNAAFATGSSPAPGLLQGSNGTGNQGRMEDLLVALSGSLSDTSQYRFVNSVDQGVAGEWNDPFSEFNSVRDTHQNEFSAFFKDDFKVTDDLTLNLGVRWDYYGVPYEENGLTGVLEDGSAGLFSISGRSYDTWQSPGARAAPSKLIFVGPNSPNPGLSAYKKDWNNFGPAVGFAYQLPWLGRDRTTIRGGYQVSYAGGGRGDVVGDLLTLTPGSGYRAEFEGPAGGDYFDYQDVLNGVGNPVNPPVPPITDIPFTDKDSQFNTFDSNLVSPYIQNMTLSVTHSLNSRLTLDARYVGTLGRKLFGNINLNEENFLFNGLLDAFNSARAGGESGLLDQIFHGIAMNGAGRTGIDAGASTGAAILRTHPALRNNLARGLYEGVADTLSELNYSNGLNSGLAAIGSGEKGGVIRVNMPENFIRPNPQFGTTNLQTNIGHNNYHSFQGQVTLRPTFGVNLQATYTWSKNLGVDGFTSPFDRSHDYVEQRGRRHTFQTYGTFALPVGPGQLIAGNSSGVLARLIEGWQATWIFNVASGVPIRVINRDMLYSRGAPDLVGSFDAFDGADFVWEDGAANGDFFGGKFSRVRDPQCLNDSIVARSIQFRCNSNAIQDSSGNLVFQHPLPGEFGSFGTNNITGLGVWGLDMSIAKSVQITEDVSMTLRVDSTNILNHPQPIGASGFFSTEGPVMDVNGFSPFGSLGTKTGNREFQLKARVDF